MDLKLTGKKVLITGSTNGIGYSTAQTMLEEGAKIMLNGRNEKHVKDAVESLKAQYPDAYIRGVAADVTQKTGIELLCQYAYEQFENIDILVASVGRGKSFCSDGMREENWQNMMEVNLYSVVYLVEKLLPLMLAGASIVTVSSIAALNVLKAPIAYAASKDALKVYTKYYADALSKRGIRINTVAPGNVFFPGGRWEELMQEDEKSVKQYIFDNVPLKRFATPEEIAASIVFLASEKSSFTTGSCLVIDGGQMRAV